MSGDIILCDSFQHAVQGIVEMANEFEFELIDIGSQSENDAA
jgi:hypothetical protein